MDTMYTATGLGSRLIVVVRQAGILNQNSCCLWKFQNSTLSLLMQF